MFRTVIILGMHRSGTSCLTGSLQEAGLHLGEVNRQSRCNEKGTRENQGFMDVNDAVLASASASWDNPPADDIKWCDDHKVMRGRLIDATAQEPAWGFKDPRTVLLLDGWLEALPDAHLIATFRDPFAVAQSLHKRNNFPIEKGLALWRAYNERLLAACREHDIAMVNYDWSPSLYRQGLEAVCTATGLSPPTNGFEFFETKLRRNESSGHKELPVPLRTLHRRLRLAARQTLRKSRSSNGARINLKSSRKDDSDDGKGEPARAENVRIAALEQAARGDAPARVYDELGRLLAQEDRWPEADAAYRNAQRVRGRMFGFRGAEADAHPPADAATARATLNELCQMLARFGAQYWAEDLTNLLRAPLDEQGGPDNLCWPQSRVLPHRQHVPLPAPAGDRKIVLSVVIPVYEVKREDWLHEALDSVLSQGLDPEQTEILIVNDASKDPAAQEVAESYGPRVRYLCNQTNLGLVGNHNQCIAQAAGEFVHILHQDDRVKPGFYEALLPALQNDPDLVAGMTHTGYIDAEGRLKSEEKGLQPRGVLERWPIKLSLQIRVQFPSIIVRRSAYQAVGGFSPSLKFAFDWDMWNRIAASGPIWFEPRPLAHYRVHAGSATYQFGWLERVQDAMQTVAHMLQLLPADQRRAIAEMANYKFFERYWKLLSEGRPEETTSDQQQLIDFLLSGWADAVEADRLRTQFAALRSAAAL